MDKLNLKLASTLMKKTAMLGNYSHIKDDQELIKNAKMITEMLELPKYQPIIDKLRSSVGIINFVTNNEYQPLVELLLKKVYPSGNNDVFSMGDDNPTGGKGFIAPSFFTSGQAVRLGDVEQQTEARNKLTDTLNGSQGYMTRAWLKEKKRMTDEQITNLLGSPEPDDVENSTPKGLAVSRFETQLRAITDRFDPKINEIKASIRETEKQIRDNAISTRKLSDEDLEKMQERLNDMIEHKMLFAQEKENAIAGLKNSPAGKAAMMPDIRNTDGFLDFASEDPTYEISKSLFTLLIAKRDNKKPVELDSIVQQATILMRNLQDYTTTNPTLKQIKEQWLGLLKFQTVKSTGKLETPEEYYSRLISRLSFFISYREAFFKNANKQGRIMILDDFDATPLCALNEKRQPEMDISTARVFLGFDAKNQANLGHDYSRAQYTPKNLKEKESQRGATMKGNRVLIVMSAKRIANLPASNVVEMNIAPVDKQEGAIIVRNILALYKKEALNAFKIKNQRVIDETSNDGATRGLAREELLEKIIRNEDILGNISEETFNKMVSYIVGLGQRGAIQSAQIAIANGIEKSPDANVLDDEFNFDETRILKTLKDQVGEKLEESVKGIKRQDLEAGFEDYAYQKGTPWASHVATVKRTVDYVRALRSSNVLNKQRIKDIDVQLKVSEKLPASSPKKLTTEKIAKMTAEKKYLMAQNEKNRGNIENEASDKMPHFYILYGDAGVGKTVWGSALADLLQYPLFKIDLSNQRSKWYGDADQNCENLLNYLRSTQETVFLMDEIDRQLAMSKGAGEGAGQNHDESLVAKLLEFFGNKSNDALFIKNKVYFIMTTNYLKKVDMALKKRAGKNKVKVLRPKDKEAYAKILRSSIKNALELYPNAPVGTVNWDYIADALAKKEIDFRTISQMIFSSFELDEKWNETMAMFQNPQGVTPAESLGDLQGLGLPLTTQNLLEICSIITSSGVEGNSEDDNYGVMETASKRSDLIRDQLKPYMDGTKAFPTKPIPNPITGEIENIPSLPEEMTKTMRGEDKTAEELLAPEIEINEDFGAQREIDPKTGRKRTKLNRKLTPKEEMKKLEDEGFIEEPLIEEPMVDTTPTYEDNEQSQTQTLAPQKTKEKIASSTDYLIDFLTKRGLIQDNKFVTPKKQKIASSEPLDPQNPVANPVEDPDAIPEEPEVQYTKEEEQAEIEEMAKAGTHYYGSLIIAPMNNKVKPIQDLRK